MYFESNFVLHLNKFYKNKRKVADIYIVLDEGLAGKNLDQDDELMIFRISDLNKEMELLLFDMS
ncbi:MAG: hypothetical protein J5546_09555 [Lachnospiraceae bacterium]|nr:hypothetical protein [Lachnospiraceae bacterium]